VRTRSLAAPLLLALAPVVFFHQICLQGKAFLLRDLFNWFYPWRVFAAASLARGDFPLWNPYSYAGTPFLANMQSGLLYPPNVVFWLFDFPVAMRLFLVAQFAMSAWFTYLLLRALDCRVASSMTGALAYAYGGWMIVHIEFPNKLAAAAWLPLILLAMTLWWKGGRAKGLVLGSVATYCCVTSGYPQTTFTVLLGAAVIWCGALVAAVRETGRADRPSRKTRALDTLLSMPAIVGLGCLLAAVQILPFLEALAGSAALARNPAAALAPSLSPVHFLDLVWPHLFGAPGYQWYWGGALYQFWLGHFYVGLATLGLAAAGLCSRREGAGRFAALLGLTTLFVLGDRTPLAPWCISWLPGFSHFKWMSTTSVLAAFALSILAAMGLDYVIDDLERRRRIPAASIAAGLACCAAIVVAGLVAWMAPMRLDAAATAAVSSVALPAQRGLIAGHLGPARADACRAAILIGMLGSCWGVARVRSLRATGSAAPPGRMSLVFAGLVPVVLYIDLYCAATDLNFAGDPSVYRAMPSTIGTLRQRAEPTARVYVPDATLGLDRVMYGSSKQQHFTWAADTLLFNLNLPWQVFSASDGDPMWTRRWKAFHDAVEREGHDDVRGRLLSVANVGIILKSRGDGSTDSIEVPAYMPRAHVSAGVRRVPPGKALDEMLQPAWNPLMETLVEDDFEGIVEAGTGPAPVPQGVVEHAVSRLEYTNNTVTIEVSSRAPGYLVLADSNAAGWKATLDGRPVPVFTANHLFRGVALPAGTHTVRFAYRPASVLWGCLLSAAALVILILVRRLPVIRRWGSSRPSHGP